MMPPPTAPITAPVPLSPWPATALPRSAPMPAPASVPATRPLRCSAQVCCAAAMDGIRAAAARLAMRWCLRIVTLLRLGSETLPSGNQTPPLTKGCVAVAANSGSPRRCARAQAGDNASRHGHGVGAETAVRLHVVGGDELSAGGECGRTPAGVVAAPLQRGAAGPGAGQVPRRDRGAGAGPLGRALGLLPGQIG